MEKRRRENKKRISRKGTAAVLMLSVVFVLAMTVLAAAGCSDTPLPAGEDEPEVFVIEATVVPMGSADKTLESFMENQMPEWETQASTSTICAETVQRLIEEYAG